MIDLSDRTKVLILVGVVVVVFLFIKSQSDDTTHNEGSLKQNSTVEIDEDDFEEESQKPVQMTESEQENTQKRFNNKYMAKFETRNSAPEGKFAYSNYTDGKRGGKASDLGKFFEGEHPLDEKAGFGKSEADDSYARYIPGKPKKMKDVDKFDVDKMLPQEKNKDWFDDPYESTTVKNSHLINVYRPIGVNTISTTLKNPSHDLRGTLPNPKYLLGPFLNSSYEPDTNLRNQALCY